MVSKFSPVFSSVFRMAGLASFMNSRERERSSYGFLNDNLDSKFDKLLVCAEESAARLIYLLDE